MSAAVDDIDAKLAVARTLLTDPCKADDARELIDHLLTERHELTSRESVSR